MARRIGNTQTPSAAGLSDIVNLKQNRNYVKDGIYPTPDNDALGGVRFDGSNYLSKVYSTSLSNNIISLSFWVKRSKTSTYEELFGRLIDSNGNLYTKFRFNANDTIDYRSWDDIRLTNAVSNNLYRDNSSWYHIVLNVTMTTSVVQAKIYVNGTEVSYSSQTSNGITGDRITIFNNNTQDLGNVATNIGNGFNGYLANIHFIDGLALDPTYFAYTDRETGQWKPKRYTGNFGTNGFYLPMETDKYMARFNGTNTQITGGNFNTNSILSNTPFTIAFWVRQKEGFATDRFISATSNGGTSDGFFIRSMTSAGNPASSSYNMDMTLDQTSGGRPIDYFPWKVEVGEWSLVTITWDGTTTSNKLIAYVNGAVNNTGTAAAAASAITHTYNFKFGASPAGSSNFYDGSLAQYAIWHRELTSQEVSDLYNLGINGDFSSIHNGDLQVYYTLNNVSAYTTKDTTTVVNDRTTNGINLTPSNFSSFPMLNAGFDESSNRNDWDTIEVYHYDSVPDSPQNTFATLNPLNTLNSGFSLLNGNLSQTSSTATNRGITSTFEMTSGNKYYFEVQTNVSLGIGNNTVGILPIISANRLSQVSYIGYERGAICLLFGETSSESLFREGNGSSGFDSSTYITGKYGLNEIAGFFVDLVNNQVTVYKNGSVHYGPYNIINVFNSYVCVDVCYKNTTWNFGQDHTFAGTKTALTTPYTDANGIGEFYYPPPDGALALCTQNLESGLKNTTVEKKYYNRDETGKTLSYVGYNDYTYGTINDERFSDLSPYTSFYGGKSFTFDGNQQYLYTQKSSSDFYFPSGTDFTIEFWQKAPSTGENYRGVFGYDGSGNFKTYYRSGGKIDVYYAGGGTAANGAELISTSNVYDDTWHHIAITRESGTIKLFIDGTLEDSNASPSLNYFGYENQRLHFGGQYSYSNRDYNGQFTDLRIVKGIAVYTGNFTPPTAPLTTTQSSGTNIAAITGSETKLLLQPYNTETVNNTSPIYPRDEVGKILDYNGGVGFVNVSPYADNSVKSFSFNGSTGVISVTNSDIDTGGSAQTHEFWLYIKEYGSGGAYSRVYGNVIGAFTSSTLNFRITDAQLELHWSPSGGVSSYTSFTPLPLKTWTHIAIVHDGTTNSSNLKLYVNGILNGSINAGAVAISGDSMYFGGYYTSGPSEFFNGLMSDIRIVKGTAVYTGAFTPPSGKLTTTGGTYPSTTNVNTSITAGHTVFLAQPYSQPATIPDSGSQYRTNRIYQTDETGKTLIYG